MRTVVSPYRCVAHAADRLGDVDVVTLWCRLDSLICAADNAKHMQEWETGGVIMTHAGERAGRRGDDPSTAVVMILRLQIVRAARYIGDTHGLQGSVEVLCSVPRAP